MVGSGEGPSLQLSVVKQDHGGTGSSSDIVTRAKSLGLFPESKICKCIFSRLVLYKHD